MAQDTALSRRLTVGAVYRDTEPDCQQIQRRAVALTIEPNALVLTVHRLRYRTPQTFPATRTLMLV